MVRRKTRRGNERTRIKDKMKKRLTQRNIKNFSNKIDRIRRGITNLIRKNTNKLMEVLIKRRRRRSQRSLNNSSSNHKKILNHREHLKRMMHPKLMKDWKGRRDLFVRERNEFS